MSTNTANSEDALKSRDASYILHFSPFSLYSLMIRFSLVISRRLSPESAPNVQIKLVNLAKDENFSEEYLTQVNSRGQVPALTSPEFATPLAESRDIATWLCERRPALVPDNHREVIMDLLNKFYSYHCKALSIPPNGLPNKAATMLENPNLTATHRRALEIKSQFHNTLHTRTVEPENIQLVEANTKSFMQDLTTLLQAQSRGDSVWIFGEQPTILDAYATVFILRLGELKRDDLTTAETRAYAAQVKGTHEWDDTTHGRPTLWNESLGPVESFDPL